MTVDLLRDVEQDIEDVIVSAEPDYVLAQIDGDLMRLAAGLAIRFLKAGLVGRLVMPNGDIRDSDLLSLIGVSIENCMDATGTREILERAMDEQLASLVRSRSELEERVDRNLQEMGRMLSLPEASVAVLRIALISQHAQGLNDLWGLERNPNIEDFSQLTGKALGIPRNDIRIAVGPRSPLRRAGLIRQSHSFEPSFGAIRIDPLIADTLLGETLDTQSLLRAVAGLSRPARLTLADFPHLACEVTTTLRFLRAASEAGTQGVNILIHGEPGVGKTELVRALAQAAGLQLHEVPTEDRDGDPIEHQQRLGAFTTSQKLLRETGGRAVLFDEVEDVFPVDGNASGRHRGSRVIPKGHLNELLESTPVPTFWVSNAVSHIDTAFLRRFPLIIRVTQLPQNERERLARTALDGIALPRGTAESVAAIEAMTPALIDSNARVLRMIASADARENLTSLKSMMRNALSAMGQEARWQSAALRKEYRLDWLNPSQPLGPLIDGLSRSRCGRICLYGLPGTGKTAFAHYLGTTIGCRVLVRRASDLLSKFVGDTEQNIASMFDEATRDGAILLIDEADSMLGERTAMTHQWQISQVNEMLTRMEAFEGIFIASTNLLSHLDDASLRRFDFKLRFDPPSSSKRMDMVMESFCQLTGITDIGSASASYRAEVDRLDGLTPGDIATVRRQCEITCQQPNPADWITLLRRELDAKRKGQSRAIGFVT